MRNLRVLALIAVFCGLSDLVHAVEFHQFVLNLGLGAEMPAVRISGRIEAGDAKTFKEVIATKGSVLRKSVYLSLDSPGGNLQEAIALAKLIRQVGFYTVVEEGASCISACFILYAAGFERLGQLPLIRSSSEETTIGVHRAFIDRSEMAKLSPSVASDVVRRLTALSSDALRDFDIPEDTIQQIQRTPAASVRFLTVGQLSAIPTPAWFVDLAIAKCNLRLPDDNTPEAGRYFARLSECQAKVMYEHHFKQFPAPGP